MIQTLAIGSGDALLWVLLVAGPGMAIYGAMQLVNDLRKTDKRKIADRLKSRGGGSSPARATLEELRKTGPKLEGMFAAAMARYSFMVRLQSMLDQANLTWSAYSLLTNMTLVACVLLAIVLLAGLPIYVGLGVAVMVYLLPVLYLMHVRRARLKKLVLQLPDVFELLSQALRAGHSLASGMQLIARELPDPAGTEFGRVFHEQNLGLKIEDALKNLADRMDVLDVRFFVTAVLIQRQTGGDLAEVLDKISSVIRDRIKLHGTVQALTAEGRLSGYVLLALPILVYLAMLKINYDYAMMLVYHPTGQMMAMAAIIMMIMGWVMIKKIININV